jgi:hypothetical protein
VLMGVLQPRARAATMPSMSKKVPRARVYRTGLCDIDVISDLELRGRRFRIIFPPNRDPFGSSTVLSDGKGGFRRLGPGREARIVTNTDERAQRVADLLLAAWAVVQGGITLLPDYLNVVSAGHDEPQHASTHGISLASALAARASQRKALTIAICRLFASYKTLSVHYIDMHPQYGQSFHVAKNPVAWAMFAQASTSAFTAIEDLNLKVETFDKKPPRSNGVWDPVARHSLDQRLQRLGIDPSTEILSTFRGTPTKIERNPSAPTGRRARWSRGRVRDRHVNVADLILYAQLIRNRASAHGRSRLLPSLTTTDVWNVQNLARELILRAAGLLKMVTGQQTMKGTIRSFLQKEARTRLRDRAAKRSVAK